MVILVQERYEMFKESIREVRGRLLDPVHGSGITARDHPSVIEVPLFLCVKKLFYAV